MSQSLSKVLVHLVFSTKNREAFITADIEPKLHAYMVGILRELKSPSLLINGMQDHIHALFRLSPKIALSEVIMEVKRGSSKWIKTQGTQFHSFYWQNGYGSFSIGQSGVEQTISYIRNQKTHHRN